MVEARRAYEQAQDDARALVERARFNLGKAISNSRQADVSQDAITKELGLTREQVRRFQREYEKALAEDTSGSAAELELVERIVRTLVGNDDAPACA